MTTVNVSMPDEMMAFVKKQIAEGGYESPDAYLRALVKEAQVRRAKQALEAKLLEALDSGPATPMNHEDWVALRQEAIDGLADENIRP